MGETFRAPLETDALDTCLGGTSGLPTLPASLRDLLLRLQGTCVCLAQLLLQLCGLYAGTLEGTFTGFAGTRRQFRGLLPPLSLPLGSLSTSGHSCPQG